MFTIFNFEGGGHVVVSNEDLAKPVIGYGLTSYQNPETVNPGLKMLFNRYKNEIDILKKGNFSENRKIKEEWNSFINGTYSSQLKSYTIGDNLVNTNWHQETPYNDSCPIDPNTNERCLVGCNGVALGMVLDYWGDSDDIYPDSTVTHSCWTLGSSTYTVNFYNQSYNWNDIGNTTSATSQFLRDCALATTPCPFTSENTASSIGEVKDALESFFSFKTDGVKNKSSYTSVQWESLLKEEINNERPVIYSAGSTVNFGHTWIIDGYNSSNLFHCNWGWGNTNNENMFYTLTSLNPQVDGTTYYFDEDFKALIGIKPMLGSDFEISTYSTSALCSDSSRTYTVVIPSTASVQWSISRNLNPVDSTNSSYTVEYGSLGEAYVKATIKNSQGQTLLTRSKTVWAGKPDFSWGPLSTTELYPREFGAAAIVYPAEDTTMGIDRNSADWSYSGPLASITGDWRTAQYRAGTTTGMGFINFEIENTCGTTNDDLYYQVVSFLLMTVSPNPSNTETTLTIDSFEEETTFDENTVWKLDIFDQSQMLKFSRDNIKGKSTKINTSSWKEGMYFFRIQYSPDGKSEEVLNGKLMVQR